MGCCGGHPLTLLARAHRVDPTLLHEALQWLIISMSFANSTFAQLIDRAFQENLAHGQIKFFGLDSLRGRFPLNRRTE